MLLLTSTTDRLQVVTDAAAAIDVHTSWVDTNVGTGLITPGRTNTSILAAATTSIAGAPAVSIQRNVRTVHIRNKHATLATNVTVTHSDGIVTVELIKYPLGAGAQLEYTDENGWSTTVFGTGSSPPVVAGGAGGGVVAFERLDDTHVRLVTLAGDAAAVKIAGITYRLPPLGITQANTACFVNGVGGSSLAVNTTYLVCLFVNAGALTMDFLTTLTNVRDATPGNEGVQICSGDSSRSVIGMVRTGATSQFVDTRNQRFVRGWFNRSAKMMGNDWAFRTLAPTSYADITPDEHVEFVSFAGDVAQMSATFSFSSNYYTAVYNVLFIDDVASAAADYAVSVISNVDPQMYGSAHEVNVINAWEPTDGFHYISLAGLTGVYVNTDWRSGGFRGLLTGPG